MEPIKRCACGRSYTRDEWETLPYCGFSRLGQIELRHCKCGSTIGVDAELLEPTPQTLRTGEVRA